MSEMGSLERAHVVKLLEESRDALRNAVEDLSDDQWLFRSAPDRWSIGENVEHLGRVERSLFGRLEAALAAPANPDWHTATDGKTTLLERLLLDRSLTRDAPEQVRPTGTTTRAEALRQYEEARATTLSFSQETQAPLQRHTQDHHRPVYGTLNGYQWLLYIPLHNLRHNQQIAEVIGKPGFPGR